MLPRFCVSACCGKCRALPTFARPTPPEVDFCPIELPGRAARLDEPPFTSMSLLMEQLHDALQPLMAVPFGFFGHSVGAWMAYEAARQLRSVDGRRCAHLFVSGRGSPKGVAADLALARPRSDDELLAILRGFGGTPAAIMQRPELVAVLLPALRADLALVDGYRPSIRGSYRLSDHRIWRCRRPLSSWLLQSWRDFTSGNFRTRIFPGGHFYFRLQPGCLPEIVEDLHASVGMGAANIGLPT